MKLHLFFLGIACFFCGQLAVAQSSQPVRIGIDGLSHDHIHGLLRNYEKRQDIQIVGIAEKNKDLVQRLAKRYGFDIDIVYDDLATMIDKTHPQGVVAFNSIYEHLHTVEICAPKGVHVMVEKPLAVNSQHAQKIAQLAEENRVYVLTNYETTWYPTHYKAYDMAISHPQIGDINKVLIHDGHKGPREIGCSEEFLAWLTDPVLNGGGAVIDFGCYGANLMTWLMQNELPLTVTAVLQQIKPEVYPQVDDQATIILTYPHAQAIIQGSWNWPVDRKDIEIYGKTGYIKALNGSDLEYRLTRELPVQNKKVTEFPTEANEPFNYFSKIISGQFQVNPTDLSSLENNLIVVQILDAAKKSAKEGKTIKIKN
ncbi:MAG: Gfo/Idh/MocA family oxidoreductase [Dysgonamonadaceae bacterium]|jgi:predicted dehydrogenase|nr:Gfo/Idh/MocA family oxidoreductase [Dysgonamonadaceae bacterium]